MLSYQIIELLFFAAVALFLINKLMSVLGNVEDVNIKTNLKDVTSTGASRPIDDNTEMQEAIVKVENLIGAFDIEKFLTITKIVFQSLIEALINKSEGMEALFKDTLDPRFQEIFLHRNYEKLPQNPLATLQNIFVMGNNITITVKFTDIDFEEQWTFSRNALSAQNNWYLSNIE